MSNRVVVTGMGAVSPLGLTASESWKNAVEGVSGVGPITLFDSTELLVHIACEVKGFDPEEYIDLKETRRRDRFEQFGAAASKQALAQSGLQITPENAGRIAVIISSAVGGIGTFQSAVETLISDGARRLSPFMIPMFMGNGAAGTVAIDIGAKGPSFSVASACASGADGIGQAWMLIRAGVIDAAIAGGAEATLTKVAMASFDRLGALSRRNGEMDTTPQPFDLNRDGL